MTDPSIKIALGIEYQGKNYYGWQKQVGVASVQAEVEKALSFVANQSVAVFCAGRTDSGVHATGQVVHFETSAQRPEHAWVLGGNANLPDDIVIKWAKIVTADFHARFSATARRYNYIIYNSSLPSAIQPYGLTHYAKPLDHHLMHQAGQFLLGEHDFSAFRSSQCQSSTPWRNVHFLEVNRHGNYIIVDIQANAFLHHMVRNIVGCLLEVGAKRQEPNWIKELLAGKNRTLSAPTAPANGLYLIQAHYPEHFNLPENSPELLFL